MENIYKRHRFPPSIIQYAVWLYHRFNLSIRDVEDLLAERNISVSYEAIRLWMNKLGPEFSRRLKRKHQGYGDTFYLDEVFVKIRGKQHYLWRAVDQDGEVVDVYLQERRDAKAVKRFFQRFLQVVSASIVRGLGRGDGTLVEVLGTYFIPAGRLTCQYPFQSQTQKPSALIVPNLWWSISGREIRARSSALMCLTKTVSI